MIAFTPEAERQLDDLRQYYRDAERLEALRNLETAMFEAAAKIENDPTAVLATPRPYPQLARAGLAWVKAGRYWVAYLTAPTLAIAAIFYDAANIPGRFRLPGELKWGIDADPRTVPRKAVREWLLELASGNFDTPPPPVLPG